MRDRFKRIIKTLSEGIIIFDKKGFVKEINQAALDMLDVSPDEIIGKPHFAGKSTLIDEEGSALSADDIIIPRVLETGETFKNVIRGLKKADGSITWFKASITPMLDSNNGIEEIVNVMIDITELYNLKKKDRKILETAKEGYWEVKLSGEIIKVNRALSSFIGYREEELIGKTVYDIADGDGRKILEHALNQLRFGVSESYAVTLKCKKGFDVYTMISTSPLLDSSGKAVGGFAFITDLSDLRATHRELERQHSTISAINEAIVSYVRSDDIREPIEHILDIALRLTGSEYGAVASFNDADGKGLRILALKGVKWADDVNRGLYERAMQQYSGKGYISCPFMDNLFGTVIQIKKPVISNKAGDPYRKGVPEGHMPLHAFMGVPFMWHERVMGLIALANKKEGYTGLELELVEAMARSISLILYRDEEREASVQKDNILNAIASFSRDLTRTLAELEAYEIFKHYLLSLRKGEARIDAVFLVNIDPSRHFAEEVISYNNSGIADPGKFPGVEKCKAYIFAGTFIIKDLSNDYACPFHRLGAKSGSYCCTAISIGGAIAGVLYMYSKTPRFFTEDIKETIDSFIALLAPVVNNIRLLEMNKKLALIDPLTGLYNRRYLEAFMDKQLAIVDRNNQLLSIIMFDIDNFKTFNDTHGHEAGDIALKSISHAIGRNIRASDVGVRYGGEEFIIALPNTDKMTALDVAERIRTTLETTPISIGLNKRAFITASFGIATYGMDASSLDAMIVKADTALYSAKKAGKNNTCVWQE